MPRPIPRLFHMILILMKVLAIITLTREISVCSFYSTYFKISTSLVVKRTPFPKVAFSSFSTKKDFRNLNMRSLSVDSAPVEIEQDSLGNDNMTKVKTEIQAGHVYFVATPIGNLGDITSRALEILRNVDLICAEDTRHTTQLLRLLSIPFKPLISHHEHNQRESIDKILSKISQGLSIAVVSDAGTPGISDPGISLASALLSRNIPIHPIPGPSAVISALSICGFNTNPFTFLGFLPVKGKERKGKVDFIANCDHTLVIYEAPHRIVSTFKELNSFPELKDRSCIICRELTKKYEEIKKGTISSFYQSFLESEKSSSKKVKIFLPFDSFVSCFPLFLCC
jgi:16S rRNA (cytidine1402-2'-O)-methyltransferase